VILLGLDTSTPATAVGLRLADGTTLQAHDIPQDGQRPGHATRLLPLADELLAEAAIGWDSLQRIAVGLGPGTFTGLRVGVATARGLAHSLAIELVGVSSLHALAYHALSEGGEGPVLAAIDARRGEVFVGGWSSGGSCGRELFAPRALAPENIWDLLRDGESWRAVGDGAVRYRSHFEDFAVEVPPDDSVLHRISGATICELGLQALPCASQAVLPDYLRRPDAEIALQGAAR
jgi:tRNA threonylcarbamoyladenosine biosynthesis protein TsaB